MILLHSISGVGVNLGNLEINDSLRLVKSEFMLAVQAVHVRVIGNCRYSLVSVMNSNPQFLHCTLNTSCSERVSPRWLMTVWLTILLS